MFPAPYRPNFAYQSTWQPNQLQTMENVLRLRQKAASGGGQVASGPGFLPGDRPMPMLVPQSGPVNPIAPQQPGLTKKRKLGQSGTANTLQAPQSGVGTFDPRLMDFV